MAAKYSVYNIAGGVDYRGNSLKKAIELSQGHFNEPYVHSSKGKRPVYNGQIGEWNQSYEELVLQDLE